MTLRHLVPALGLAALTATSFAAEKDMAPAVIFEGWSDNVLTYNSPDDNRTGTTNNPATAKDEDSDSLRFTSTASLKANWKVADAVTARVNVWLYPGSSTGGDPTATPSTYNSNSNVNLRESYVVVGLGNGFSWQMGKAINHIGWIAAEPTGLYSVNSSLINYTNIYGNDVIGTGLIYNDSTKSPVSAQLHLTNGYATSSDAVNGAPNGRRENTDLGIGFGATYTLPNEMGNIDLDLYYDMHSDANGTAGTDLGGDVFLIGLNATIKPVKELTLGVEVMLYTVDDAEAANGAAIVNSARDRIQFMLLGNYAIPGAPANMSLTGLIQYIQLEPDTLAAAQKKETHLEVAGVVMTTPFGSKYFGVNYELAYYTNENINFGTVPTNTVATETSGINFSIEAIASF